MWRLWSKHGQSWMGGKNQKNSEAVSSMDEIFTGFRWTKLKYWFPDRRGGRPTEGCSWTQLVSLWDCTGAGFCALPKMFQSHLRCYLLCLRRGIDKERTVTSWQEGHPGVVRIYWAIFFFSGVWQWNKILTKVLVRRYQAFPAGKTGSSLFEWNTASQDSVVVLKSSCLGGFFSPLMPVLKEGKQFSKYTASPGCLFPVRCGISCSGR